MFTVYIVYSASLDKYYIGYTTDIEKRLLDHNSGISIYTARACDWLLQYQERYATREEAMKRERLIKSKKSRKYLLWLIAQGHD